MNAIDELKELMLKIGIKECIVNETHPAQPLRGGQWIPLTTPHSSQLSRNATGL